jgi:hypothetical protein
MYIDHEDAGSVYLQNISNMPTSTWCNNSRTKFASTVNHCESLESVTSNFLIQHFHLMGCGFYTRFTFEKKGKKNYSYFFAKLIMLCSIFCELSTNILKETANISIKYPI